ncbi:MAG TPA: M48 family metallopeptidase, partial [Planctomycetota bacterium]|nr:M48 family metallopeptidase [Planctomycetota bacterium]
TPEHGAVQELGLERLRLRRDEGGALIATDPGSKTSVVCDDPEFLRALETVAGNELNEAISRLEGLKVSSRGQHLFGCFLALVFTGLLLWSLPSMFHKAIRTTVAALPTSVDKAIGENVQEAMETGGPVLDDEAIRAPLQTLLDRLTPHAPLEGIEYQFRVVRSDVSNAYALPGGYITIFSGLIEQSATPEQVAGVLAHEIAHVERRHGLHRVAQQAGMMASMALLVGDLSGLEAIAVKVFTMQQGAAYSQEQETEADLEGVRILIDAGINPEGLVQFFELMRAEVGDVPAAMSWVSSHPRFDERIAAIRADLATRALPEQWQPLDLDWEQLKQDLSDQ